VIAFLNFVIHTSRLIGVDLWSVSNVFSLGMYQ